MGDVAVPRDLRATEIQQLMQQALTTCFGVAGRPDNPIQWLSDNGSIYTVLETIRTAERLHLVPITTSPWSRRCNGVAEAFVHTLRRDYQAGAETSTAEHVLAQIPAGIADNTAVAPHSALGPQSLQQYRSAMLPAGLIGLLKQPLETWYRAMAGSPRLTKCKDWIS